MSPINLIWRKKVSVETNLSGVEVLVYHPPQQVAPRLYRRVFTCISWWIKNYQFSTPEIQLRYALLRYVSANLMKEEFLSFAESISTAFQNLDILEICLSFITLIELILSLPENFSRQEFLVFGVVELELESNDVDYRLKMPSYTPFSSLPLLQ